jgi:hypothetical protein
MKRNLAIPAAILLIGGAVAIVVLKKDDSAESTTNALSAKKEQPAANGPSWPGGSASSPRSNRPAPPVRVSREGELVKKYGRAETAQARQVSENVVSILDDVIALGEMMMKGGQQFGGGRRGMMNGITRRMGIELTEDQQDQAMALVEEWQNAQMKKTKDAVSNLRSDPTAMMELFLAGDAKERGEMDEADYTIVRDEAAGQLADIINPLDQNNFRGDRRMANDENLMNQFAEILDPEQAEQFSNFRQEQAASRGGEGGGDTSITSMPTMELQTLDDAVGNAKNITAGFRQVVEGMGAMRQLQPQIEPGSEGGE